MIFVYKFTSYYFQLLNFWLYLFLSVSFSRKRKSERIESKFKTQNPNPKYEGFFSGVVKVQGHGVFQIG